MFKKLCKQDRQGVRKPSDVERKYNLGEVVETVRVIQEDSVPEKALEDYYTETEIDHKMNELKEELESQIPNGDYRIVDDVVEWFNPPMELDTEYRTTERWLGKPVYTKLVRYLCQVEHGSTMGFKNLLLTTATPNFEALVRYGGTITRTNEKPKPIPYFDIDDSTINDDGTITTGLTYGGYIGVQNMSVDNIVLTLNKVLLYSNTAIHLQVWYTKTE